MTLKIIHVLLGKANPERMNGVNKVVNSLATYQKKLGYDVHVWGITKTLIKNYPERNYSTLLFLDKGKFRLDSRVKKALTNQPEKVIFHIHGAFIPQFYILSRLLVKNDLAYVYTPHGAYNSIAMERSSFKKKIYLALFERYLVKHAHKLHFIGASEKNGARKLFSELNYALIPNGQNLEETVFEFHCFSKKDTNIFGFVGRLDIKTKGLDILLKGFAKHHMNSEEASELWLIGDGPERTRLQALAKYLKIENQIKFFGSRFGKEKLNLMANMDYLCLTSRNEGLPGVVLEAAAVGTPAIVSPETNVSEFIKSSQAGLYLSQNNSENLSKELDKAVMYKLSGRIKEMSTNAKKMVQQHFNWIGISKRLIEAYES